MKWYDDLLMFSHIILEIPHEIYTLVGEYFDQSPKSTKYFVEKCISNTFTIAIRRWHQF
jgi:hypothetical protein